VRGTFTAKNLDFSKDVLFLADNGFDSLSVEPVVTDIEDLAIKEEHLPLIEREYEVLCDEYVAREARGEGFNFFHFNVGPNAFPRAARETNIFPSFPTATFTPVTSLRAIPNGKWETFSKVSSTRTFAGSLQRAVFLRVKSAGIVLLSLSVRAVAARITITITAISKSHIR